MDLEALLQSFGDDEPSGEDLEYDPAFSEMEIAAQPKEEQQVGDSIIAAEEPDWAEVVEKAQEVMSRSHDLRAAIFFANASLRREGFVPFATSVKYIRGCLDEFWASCHPQLDADDDDDPTMRVNALAALTDSDGILRSVRLAPLTDSRGFGRFGLRDVSVASGEMTAPADMESVPDTASISAAFQDTDDDWLTGVREAITEATDDLVAINDVLGEKLDHGQPDLDPLLDLLKTAGRTMAQHMGAEIEEDEGEADSPVSGSARPVSAPSGGGAINNTNDVINMLDRMCDYYQRNEPSSPVPMLLQRARRLVGADYITIMKDMAPDGVDQVATIGGITVEEEEY